MDNRDVIASYFACWSVQDVERTAEHFHHSVIYELHVADSQLPLGRVRRGKAECRDALFEILKDFDYLKYEATIISVVGNTVRASVAFKYRHRPTGEILEGTRRLVFKVRDGLILRIDGYHDARLVEVFMRLTRQRMATNQIERPPQLPRGRQPLGSGAGG
jgi:ketosteroid isomerase-like protein